MPLPPSVAKRNQWPLGFFFSPEQPTSHLCSRWRQPQAACADSEECMNYCREAQTLLPWVQQCANFQKAQHC